MDAVATTITNVIQSPVMMAAYPEISEPSVPGLASASGHGKHDGLTNLSRYQKSVRSTVEIYSN
jgi:hypothetical protein